MPAFYYQDELITLYCGDSREILPQIPPGSVDVLLTDPVWPNCSPKIEIPGQHDTTLVAAKQAGRRAIGIEISEEFCRIAVQRLQQRAMVFEANDWTRVRNPSDPVPAEMAE